MNGKQRLSNKSVQIPTSTFPLRCKSSSKYCDTSHEERPCNKIKYPRMSVDVAFWTCENNVNPYQQSISDGTICTSL